MSATYADCARYQVVLCLCALMALGGCSRMHYRHRADRDSYRILDEKTGGAPWQPAAGFRIDPDPRSRFYDASSPVDPALPAPNVELYAYSLPEFPARDPRRYRGTADPGGPPPAPVDEPPALMGQHIPHGVVSEGAVALASYETRAAETAGAPPSRSEESSAEVLSEELRIVPIPTEIWESVPPECLVRLFEFPSMQQEYQRTCGHEPTETQRDSAPKMALEDVLEQALINSREYQTQKELLYRAALRLTLERYDYDLKFAVGGGRSELDFKHTRDAGLTSNELRIPTTVAGDRLLGTGGNLVAQFANSIVLTFNGSHGFAADVGSELLFSLSQTVFQRDSVLENLTQAERDVVYAARKFARYRKSFFAGLARHYYSLLLSYRSIEIAGLDYFGNLRGFYRAQAECRAGRLPRFQVDQFEQSSLNSRSKLIEECNRLELGLDNLKLAVGLPPELPVNLDLTELFQLTLRDEATAAAERVRRARKLLLEETQQAAPDRSVLLNVGLDLAARMLRLMELLEKLAQNSPDRDALQRQHDRLRIRLAEAECRAAREALLKEQAAQPPAPPLRVFQRTLDVIDALLVLGQRHLATAARLPAPPPWLASGRQTAANLQQRREAVRAELETSVTEERLQPIVADAEKLLADAERWRNGLEQQGSPPRPNAQDEMSQTRADMQRLLAHGEKLLAVEVGGLTPISLAMDDALLTALSLRLDLMNQRGELADYWRKIKLAGDDLQSILNLSATQRISTRSGLDRPFDFTFDDSQTQLGMTLDAPVNRRQQRNKFRESLIDYNLALRNLMALEDTIKQAVRNDLRQLEQNREQYRIAVASTALAYERVVSTRLQLILGVQKVTARDVLESQQAYTTSLNAMARARVSYVLGRIDLFVDLELLEVDAAGFWPHVYDMGYQPQPHWELPAHARPAYGDLPRGVRHSRAMRRMLAVPAGATHVYRAEGTVSDGP